ncbi:MAG TPA: sugar phosphate nucleotidyltransferase [Verrucomicrobiae bacterium]|jgi:mannose-1-phosphate guanylyltransferase|nr:sugar phosphate nucleotidyltransferase [Verrucomicrobiae bacterium]
MLTHRSKRPETTSSLWGVVLAGGEYKRVAPFIRELRGDSLPKPFVNVIGKRSMLEHTFARAEKLVAPERLLVVVKREDLKHPEAQRQIGNRLKQTVIVQPQNKGSLAEVLLPLLHIYHRDPLATVALFPADHFILQEDRFLSHLYLACRAVERTPSAIIALGIRPHMLSTGLGYIVPCDESDPLRGFGIRRVSSFVEDPPESEAPKLLERGAFWNSMAIVFKAFTLFDLIARIAPSIHAAFEGIGGGKERQAVDNAFRRISRSEFCTELLAALPQARPDSFLVLPVEGVLWNDCATPLQVVTVLTKAGYLGRANGLSERRLFALWSDHRDGRKTESKKNTATLRMG